MSTNLPKGQHQILACDWWINCRPYSYPIDSLLNITSVGDYASVIHFRDAKQPDHLHYHRLSVHHRLHHSGCRQCPRPSSPRRHGQRLPLPHHLQVPPHHFFLFNSVTERSRQLFCQGNCSLIKIAIQLAKTETRNFFHNWHLTFASNFLNNMEHMFLNLL